MLEMMAIRLALKQAITFIHHSCIMISTDNTTVVSYINKQGGTHSPNLSVEVWEILNCCLEHDIVIRVHHIPGKFNILADCLSRLDKPIKTEWALDQTVANSVFQMLKFPNVDLFATRFNHKLPLYVSPVQDNKALVIDALSMDWNHLHAYAFPPFILIPAVLEKIQQHQCRIVLIAPFWPQQQWFSTSSSISVSYDSSATNSKTLDSIQRKICSSKPPTSRPSCLGVIKQSIQEKKCQISTIKGYRAMISNNVKFKTGNRIGSNPVLSELIRSFELQ